MRKFKVFVEDKSFEIIKHLKAIGYSEDLGYVNASHPFIYVKSNNFTTGNMNSHFQASMLPRLTPTEVLELEKELEFKPFEKVLVREYDVDTWRAAFFSGKLDDYYLTCGGKARKQCIRYEGNEQLWGTSHNP